MSAIVEVREQLLPLVDALIGQLEQDADVLSARWFSDVRTALLAADSEEDLIFLFIEHLGPTGPMAQTADFSPLARLRLDMLLARAEQVAWAFSAGGEPH